jgi:predicted transcriptional regulator
MPEMQMGAVESRFAEIIWKNAPVTASQLAKLAEVELGFKKTTSYTVLKRLCEKGIFRNDSGTVHAMLSREQFYALQSEKFLEETYNGSLPAFIAAFASRKAISPRELAQIRQMLDEYEQGGAK